MSNELPILIGSHVPMCGSKYFLGSVEISLNNGANTFMFYTGSPQSLARSPIEKCKIDEAIKLMEQSNIDINNVVCHAPYLINLGNDVSSYKFDFSKKLLASEVDRCHKFHVKKLVLHPGAHLGLGVDQAIKNIAYGINEVLKDVDYDIKICLETMAGKGTEVGSKLEEIKKIIDLIDKKDKIGVCIDTCHLNDAGYDLSDSNAFLKMFDDIVGLKYLEVVHLNDSLNTRGAHKDRHANIGLGKIGYKILREFAFNPILKNVPKILETPYFNGKSPYKLEIEMLVNNDFNSSNFLKL